MNYLYQKFMDAKEDIYSRKELLDRYVYLVKDSTEYIKNKLELALQQYYSCSNYDAENLNGKSITIDYDEIQSEISIIYCEEIVKLINKCNGNINFANSIRNIMRSKSDKIIRKHVKHLKKILDDEIDVLSYDDNINLLSEGRRNEKTKIENDRIIKRIYLLANEREKDMLDLMLNGSTLNQIAHKYDCTVQNISRILIALANKYRFNEELLNSIADFNAFEINDSYFFQKELVMLHKVCSSGLINLQKLDKGYLELLDKRFEEWLVLYGDFNSSDVILIRKEYDHLVCSIIKEYISNITEMNQQSQTFYMILSQKLTKYIYDPQLDNAVVSHIMKMDVIGKKQLKKL